jgi:multiple sugar transport system substrate-binding protein
MIRRRLSAVLLLLTLVATACDGGAATPTQVAPAATGTTAPAPQAEAITTPAQAAPAASSANGEITFQVFGDPVELAIFEELVAEYGKFNPNVKVQINHVPSQGEFMTKLSGSFTAGNPPDVFLLNDRRYGQFAARDVLEPVGPWLDRSTTIQVTDYYTHSMAAFTYKGTLQCLPQNVSSLDVYYNKTLFEQNNVPLPTADWTWQDFLSAAKALTKDTNGDGAPDTYGVGVEPIIIRLAPFVWQHGGEIVDNYEQPARLTLDTPAAREGVQFFMELSLLHRVVPTEAEVKAQALDTQFMNGKLAMFLSSRVETPTFREGIKDFTWDVAPLPRDQQAATILHADAYCMAKASPNKEATWDFIQFAQGPQGQAVAARRGRTVPSLKAVANSPDFLDPAQPPANSRVYLDVLPSARISPVISTWPAVESAVNNELERAFYGTAPIDTALQLAMEKANAEFAKADRK